MNLTFGTAAGLFFGVGTSILVNHPDDASSKVAACLFFAVGFLLLFFAVWQESIIVREERKQYQELTKKISELSNPTHSKLADIVRILEQVNKLREPLKNTRVEGTSVTTEEKLDALDKKITQYHEEDKTLTMRIRWENIGYISGGFAIATAALFPTQTSSTSKWSMGVAAVFFLIIGLVLVLSNSKKLKGK